MTIAKPWVSGLMNYAGIACYYNSQFDPPSSPGENAVLTIWLRVNLVQMTANPKDPFYVGLTTTCPQDRLEPVTVPIRNWSATEWQLFEQECFISSRFWDFRFYLTPPPGYAGLDMSFGSARLRPFVECRFSAKFVSASDGPHIRYQVARLAPEKHAEYNRDRLAGKKADEGLRSS